MRMTACRDRERWKLCGFTAHRCWEHSARSGKAEAWLQTADGWTEWNVERGTWQGAPAANPTCCLGVLQALLETRKKTENGQEDETRREIGELKVLPYADDAFLLQDVW